MSWKTVPQCSRCWHRENFGREPHRLVNRKDENCHTCNTPTQSGIYVRKEVQDD